MRDTLNSKERLQGRLIIWAGVVLSFIVSGIAYAYLPEKIPNLFTIDGRAIELMEKNILLFIFPVASLIIAGAMEVTPIVDPNRDNYKRFETAYFALRAFISSTFLALTIMHMIRLKYYENILSFIVFKMTIALAIMLIGNILPKLKRNYFIGFNFPWCVADERIWFKTHRFGGKYFLIIGIVMIVIAFIDNIAANVTFWCLLTTLFIVPMVYAAEKYYLQNKNIKRDKEDI